MKVYIDIVLSGKNFNPNEVATLCGLSFSKAINKGDFNNRLNHEETEDYAILSSADAEFSEALIDNLLSEYEKLSTIGEEKLGIDYKEFNLYVECLQNSFTLNTSQFIKIGRFFPKVNITYIQE